MFAKFHLRFGLSFIDKSLEFQYEKSKQYHYRMLLRILIIYGLLNWVVGCLLNPTNQPDNFDRRKIIILIIIFSSSLIVFYIGLKKPDMSKNLLWIMAFLFFFSFMEGSPSDNQNVQRNQVQTHNFILGVQIEFIAIVPVLARSTWKTSSIFILVTNVLVSFRYSDFSLNEERIFSLVIQVVVNTLIVGLLAYNIEKYDRESFKKINNYEVSHFNFKNLITNSFSSAVVLIKDEKIIFHNKNTVEILEASNESQIKERIESIQLEEEQETQKNCKLNENYKLINTENNDTSLMMPHILNYKSDKPNAYYGFIYLEGKSKSLQIYITKILWDHDIVLMVIISESEIIEQMKFLKKQSEYKDKLLATVSHDLRTPLNGIMGMIRMTLDVNENSQTKKYLSIALRSSNLLLLMINDILDYSQISNGKLRLNNEFFSMWDVIKDVSKLFKFQTKMKGLTFSKVNLIGKSKGDTLIRSDQNRVKQILFNLLGNALKFTVKGSIKISIKLWHPKEDHESLSSFELYVEKAKGYIISVEDTGIGIKKEEQQNLFKLFGKIQDESTININKSGVGLGLAISQSLVRILNKDKKEGEISVESEYGKGSCFSFVLFSDEKEDLRENINQRSLKEKSDQEMSDKIHLLKRILDMDLLSPSHKNKFQTPKTFKDKTQILVVDDDQINILVISSYLKTFSDYEFDVSFNGEEAIDIIKKKAKENYFYDVILMDCNMPKMNGAEATLVIDEMIEHEEIPTLLIIVCTANACPRDYDFRFSHGKLDHITKPFTKEEMRKKIDQI